MRETPFSEQPIEYLWLLPSEVTSWLNTLGRQGYEVLSVTPCAVPQGEEPGYAMVGVLARRKYAEYAVDGRCPKCEKPVALVRSYVPADHAWTAVRQRDGAHLTTPEVRCPTCGYRAYALEFVSAEQKVGTLEDYLSTTQGQAELARIGVRHPKTGPFGG